MLFEAHRGVSTECPENTLPAFEAAWKQGYDMIELDPRFTVDGVCTVFHDHIVNRTCRTADGQIIEQERKVHDMTWQELQQLDAGLYMGEQFRGTKVLLFKEALEFAKKTGIPLKVDNRVSWFKPEWQQEVFRLIEESGAPVELTSDSVEFTKLLVERFPNVPIHYDGPTDEADLQAVKAVLKNNALTVWIAMPSPLTDWVKVPKATPERCAMIKKYAKLGLWILETQEQLEQAKALGADIIETTGALKPQIV